jgi:hypothetical protein
MWHTYYFGVYITTFILMQTGDIKNALMNACGAGCVEMVTVLLDLGADVNYQDMVKINKKLNSTCALTADVIHTNWSYTTEWPISSLACKLCW